MRGSEIGIPSDWRRGSGRYSLLGCSFQDCNHTYAHARPICPECRFEARQKLENQKLAETVESPTELEENLTALFYPALLSIAAD